MHKCFKTQLCSRRYYLWRSNRQDLDPILLTPRLKTSPLWFFMRKNLIQNNQYKICMSVSTCLLFYWSFENKGNCNRCCRKALRRIKRLRIQSIEILLSIVDDCKQSNESCSKLRFSKGQWACLSLHNLLKIKSGVTGMVI